MAGATLLGSLAGCASSAQADQSTGGTTSSGGSYKDGTYTKNGSYASPGGQETISVQLTLKSNVVTAVTVKTVTADPTATAYEARFISGIQGVVVGKKLDALNVSRVAGSSLTSQGFNAAVEAIKADAKA
ncbi:hypothetical protein G3T37_12860 [Galbitalea soli]|uniref:FMN-binding domain-containing protein n=1 Tax=Galbitalea soli TaxID=1268042 RepID=A0A7C9TU60_9MICO|nr:hypothetical protein [Galbitalea soli]